MPANPYRLGRRLGISALLLAASVAAGTLSPARADSISGSIAYDKLNLTTADAALRTFLTAYRQGDFVSVYWIFAPSTQTAWYDHLLTFRMGSLIKISSWATRHSTMSFFRERRIWTRQTTVSFLQQL
jgi:hypothetical protein